MQSEKSVQLCARWLGVLVLAFVTVVFVTMATVLSTTASVHAETLYVEDHGKESHGVIESLPVTGTAGIWIISQQEFTVTEQTQLEGELAVGACVEVKYLEVDQALLALTIRADDDCGSDEEHDYLSITGLIETLPATGTTGVWVVGGLSFTVDAETHLEGELVEGACVKVMYVDTGAGLLALKIRASDDCGDDEEDEEDEEGNSQKLTGLIETLPATDTVGVWVVSQQEFTVDENTMVMGELAVGACVEVRYIETDAGLLALEIHADDDCGDDEEDEEDEEGNSQKLTGLIETLPATGTVGVWVVSQQEFTVDENTVLEGELAAGVCVNVTYVVTDAGLLALKIRADDDCGNGENHDEDLRGRIDALPEGENNTWIIDGVEYQQTPDTELETDFGDFDVGVCVEFEVDENDPTILTELETTRDFKCRLLENEHPDGVLFGVAEIVPDGLTGEWTIGGIVFVSDESTHLKVHNWAAVEGATVKVKFYIDENGANRALEIQTKYRHEWVKDDDGDGFRQGVEGKLYGIIEGLPDGMTGEWQVSGVTYVANDETELEEDDGPFAVGAKVKIEYVVTDDGTRIATEIETTNFAGGVNADGHFKLIGFVNLLPGLGFHGDWIIGGARFVGQPHSRFFESNGLFGLGAYVQVTYEISDNVRRIIHVQTEVPPGAGDFNEAGVLEHMGETDLSAASTQAGNAVWRVDGVEYVVSPATHLNEASGALTVGSMVLVNSYRDDSGNAIATSIQSVTQDASVYLPFMSR